MNPFLAMPDTDKVAIIAVTGVLFSALISFMSARRATYINSVTAERSKWIESLRKNIADLNSKSRIFNYNITSEPTYRNSDEYRKNIEEIYALMTLLRLQLNPDGIIDAKVLKLIRGLPIRAERLEARNLLVYEDLLIRHSQWLLKMEWEKVKYEASGLFRKCYSLIKGALYRRRYQRFCSGDGKIPGDDAPNAQ